MVGFDSLDPKSSNFGGKKRDGAKKILSVKDGKVTKKGRPISKKAIEASRNARKALATGEIASEEIRTKKDRDNRTLYLKFLSKEESPINEEAIRSLFPSVSLVRIPRQGKKKEAKKIRYCFLEFDSDSLAVNAHGEISKSAEKYFVDFVGEKSKNVRNNPKEFSKKRPINPLRLFVTGLPQDMTVEKLKKLFPKSVDAHLKAKDSVVGFVTFENAGVAKAAFDAVQKLQELPGMPKLCVMFAKMSKRQKKDKKNSSQEARQVNKENPTKDDPKVESDLKKDEGHDDKESPMAEEVVPEDELSSDVEEVPNDDDASDDEDVPNDDDSSDEEDVPNDEDSEQEME